MEIICGMPNVSKSSIFHPKLQNTNNFDMFFPDFKASPKDMILIESQVSKA